MKLKALLSILMILGVGSARANDCPVPQIHGFDALNFPVPGVFKCIAKGCYYTPKKLGVSELIAATKFNYRGKRGLPDGWDIKAGRDEYELVLAHPCPTELQTLMRIVMESDDMPLSSARRKITLVLKIYHIEDGSFNNFSFGMTGRTDAEVAEKPARGVLGAIASGFDLNYAFGNLTNDLLSINLSRSRSMSQSYKVRDVRLEFLEGEYMDRPLLRREYLSDGEVGEPTSETSGYHLRGRLYVDETDTENPLVVVKNLHLFYGVPQKDDPRALVETLEIRRQEVVIPRGRPYLLNGDSLSIRESGKSNGLPIHYEKSHIRSESKLIIFLQAWPMDSPPPQKTAHYIPLSEKQVASLKDKPEVDLLKSAKFSVLSTQGQADFDLIQFSLDEAGLSKANYKEFVYVDVRAPGADAAPQMEFQAQHLVNGKIQLPSLLGVNNGAISVPIEVTLSWENKKTAVSGQRKKNTYKLEHRLTSQRVIVRKGN